MCACLNVFYIVIDQNSYNDTVALDFMTLKD